MTRRAQPNPPSHQRTYLRRRHNAGLTGRGTVPKQRMERSYRPPSDDSNLEKHLLASIPNIMEKFAGFVSKAYQYLPYDLKQEANELGQQMSVIRKSNKKRRARIV